MRRGKFAIITNLKIVNRLHSTRCDSKNHENVAIEGAAGPTNKRLQEISALKRSRHGLPYSRAEAPEKA